MGESTLGVIFGSLPLWTEAFSGYGDGSGYGYGDGYGSAYGDGSGYGDGDGSAYGYGSGYGYLRLVAENIIKEVDIPPNAFVGFWKSDENGKPSNGGSGDTVTPGLVQEINGPLQLCTCRALHATLNPSQWKGERLWVVALCGEVAFESDKCGALKRVILGEVK